MHLITIAVCLSILSCNINTIEGQLVDIVQTAINNGNFESLIGALEAADLITTLKGDGPFTVFAPNDEAAAKLPADVGEYLLRPENRAMLVRVLKYHVINGIAITSSQVSQVTLPIKQEMFDGGEITVSRDGNNVKINNATVIQADVMATNGVIHVIDQVLIPPELDFATFFRKN